MFKNIYLHRTTQSIELMLCEAMLECNNIYNFEKTVNDPAQYIKLTDWIF
jgi:HD superfamily phosphohydrolase